MYELLNIAFGILSALIPICLVPIIEVKFSLSIFVSLPYVKIKTGTLFQLVNPDIPMWPYWTHNSPLFNIFLSHSARLI